jgi:hypothetical protein
VTTLPVSSLASRPLLALLLLGHASLLARDWVVDQHHPRASDDGDGAADRPFKSINAAAERAGPGDTVLVRPGIYRECVAPARGGEPDKPVVYRAVSGQRAGTGAADRVIVRGTEIWKPDWQPVEGHPGVYSAKPDPKMFPRDNPFLLRSHPKRGDGVEGQVFVNGRRLPEIRFPLNKSRPKLPMQDYLDGLYKQPGSWTASTEDGTIYVHFPPEVKEPGQSEVEITVRRRAFAPRERGLGCIHVQGFVFERGGDAVSYPQMGLVSCRSGHHWAIEGNVIRFARGIGLEIGCEAAMGKREPEADKRDLSSTTGRHLIRNNVIADNAQCGIAGMYSHATRIVGNVVERNGLLVPGAESGGIKCHMLFDGVVEGNLVRDNGAWGIWLDNGYQGARVTRNVVLGNSFSGVFFEISADPGGRGLADNNVIALNKGDGVYTHDASDVWVMHNLIFRNDGFGVRMRMDTSRRLTLSGHPPSHRVPGDPAKPPICTCSRQRVLMNLLLENRDGAVSFLLPNERAEANLSDHNLLSGPDGRAPLFMVDKDNKGGQGDIQAVAQAVREALAKAGAAQAPEPEVYKSRFEIPPIPPLSQIGTPLGLLLSLDLWRLVMGCDKNSLVLSSIGHEFDLENLRLTLHVDESLGRLALVPAEQRRPGGTLNPERRLAEADTDFFGKAISAEKALPGPFQELREGRNTFLLWPR